MNINKNKTNRTFKKIFFFILSIAVIILIWINSSGLTKKDKPLTSGQNTDKDFTIYIASDIHYLSDKLSDQGAAYEKFVTSGDGKLLKYIDEITDTFVYEIQKNKPDVLIVSGDLTSNGEKASHKDLAEKFKTIEKNGTQVYVVPGNHDIFNTWAREFKGDKQYVTDYISDNDFSNIYADFGFDEAVLRDESSLSYLAAPNDKLWFLMLDSIKYKENVSVGVPAADGLFKSATLKWIEECFKLAEEKGANIIPVMHHNILDHSEVIREGYTLNNNGQTLILFKKYNINLVFSGHIHVQDISSDQKSANPLYDVASGALSVFPHHYGVLKYSSEQSSLKYQSQSLDVDSWAKARHIKDKILLNFNEYSKEYFSKMAYDRAYNSLTDSGYQEEQIKLLAEVIKTLNLRYFSGTEYLNATDVIQSEGYKLWTEYPESFLKNYVATIISDKDTDDNHLSLKLEPLTDKTVQ